MIYFLLTITRSSWNNDYLTKLINVAAISRGNKHLAVSVLDITVHIYIADIDSVSSVLKSSSD